MKNSGSKSLLPLVILLLLLVQIIPAQAQQNKRWVCSIYYDDNHIDTLKNLCDYMKNGLLRVEPYQTQGGLYFVRFYLNDTFCIKKNFAWEVKVKNAQQEGGQDGYDVYLTLIGNNNYYSIFTLMGDSWAQFYTYGSVNNSIIKDKPEFVLDFSNWETIKLKFLNNLCHYIVNGKDLIDINYNGDFCYISLLYVSLKGSGSVDWFKLYDENDNLTYFEDFLDCNNPVPYPKCEILNINNFSINYNYPLCEGQTLNLNTTPPMSGNFIRWQGPNGFTSIESNPAIDNVNPSMSGIYTCTISDSLNCLSKSAKCNVIINPKPDASISSSTNFILCDGDSAILKVDNPKDSYSYKWSTGDTSQQIIVKKPGSYSVTVTDTSGCVSVSNIINIGSQGGNIGIETILPQGIFQFNTVTYPLIKCKRLILKNTGSGIITIHNVLLMRNIEFSIPQSQFPLVLQPGDTAGLEICYTPSNEGLQSDTLIIQDTCFNIRLPLLAIGMPDQLLGMSKCKENVTVTTQFKNSFAFSLPNPNPATDMLEIQFKSNNDLHSRDMKDLNIEFDLYDLYGNLIQENFKADLSGMINNSIQVSGTYSINLSHISDGYYFLRINNSGNANIFPIIINR